MWSFLATMAVMTAFIGLMTAIVWSSKVAHLMRRDLGERGAVATFLTSGVLAWLMIYAFELERMQPRDTPGPSAEAGLPADAFAVRDHGNGWRSYSVPDRGRIRRMLAGPGALVELGEGDGEGIAGRSR